MGAVVGPANHPASIARARVAVAVADGRTTRWAQISPAPNTGGFAWLVPVEPGARVDLASDAWLDALDAATVPVVFPPAAPTCLLDPPPQVLAARLSARGRESVADVAARLVRNVAIPDGIPAETVLNDTTTQIGTARFLAALNRAAETARR